MSVPLIFRRSYVSLVIIYGARFNVSYGCLVVLLVFHRKPITPQMAACIMQAQSS